jgi:hypothetical protein
VADAVEQKLESLRNEAVGIRNDLSADYAALPLNDPRRVVARHIKAVVSSTYLNWIYLGDNVSRPRWWMAQFGQVPPELQDEVTDYETLSAAACVLYPLALFEAGVRRFVRALDPRSLLGRSSRVQVGLRLVVRTPSTR